RMRIGFTDCSANNNVVLARTASAAAAETLTNRRRSILPYSCSRASVPDAIGLSKKRPTVEYDATRGSEVNRRNNSKIAPSCQYLARTDEQRIKDAHTFDSFFG